MTLGFLALGIPLAFVILGTRAEGPSVRFGLIITGVLASLLVAVYLGEETFLSSTPWYQESPWKEGILLFAMVLGMAARSLDQAIELRRERISELEKSEGESLEEKPKLTLDPWDFSRPFLVALPTFGALLSQVDGEVLSWMLVVLAFQTGFFWQTILKRSQA